MTFFEKKVKLILHLRKEQFSVLSLDGSETGTLLRLMSCKEPILLHVRKTFAHYIYTAKT